MLWKRPALLLPQARGQGAVPSSSLHTLNGKGSMWTLQGPLYLRGARPALGQSDANTEATVTPVICGEDSVQRILTRYGVVT